MREQRSYSTEAIILKQSNLGEADRILTLFTPYKGKFSAIAKGIRRPISKKTGHLELLYRSQLQVAVGRNLDIVTQAQGLESFLHLRDELWHLTCGMYLTELVERFIEDNTPHTDVYKLLLESLRALEIDATEVQQQRIENISKSEESVQEERTMHDRTKLLMRYFEIYLLSSVGYEPVLRTCANCDTELKARGERFHTLARWCALSQLLTFMEPVALDERTQSSTPPTSLRLGTGPTLSPRRQPAHRSRTRHARIATLPSRTRSQVMELLRDVTLNIWGFWLSLPCIQTCKYLHYLYTSLFQIYIQIC